MSSVLAVGPHPDDVEIAAGGTVALLAAAGHRVVMVDLTRGERATRGTPEIRAREAAEAAGILGAAERECLELPDTGVAARDPEQVNRLVSVIRKHRPRLVLTLHENDDHPDHREGAELVRRAVYLAGLRNYPGPGGEPWRAGRVLFAMGRGPFEPTCIVDVSGTAAVKRRALEAYRSQFFREADDPLTTPISEPGFLDRIEARDRVMGGRIGAAFGEPFFESVPVALRAARDLLPEADA